MKSASCDHYEVGVVCTSLNNGFQNWAEFFFYCKPKAIIHNIDFSLRAVIIVSQGPIFSTRMTLTHTPVSVVMVNRCVDNTTAHPCGPDETRSGAGANADRKARLRRRRWVRHDVGDSESMNALFLAGESRGGVSFPYNEQESHLTGVANSTDCWPADERQAAVTAANFCQG